MPGGSLDADRLLAEMDRYGIEETLVHHALSLRNSPVRGNELLIKDCSKSPRLHPCWILLPSATREFPDWDTLLDQMRQADVRAVRIAPGADYHLYSLSTVVCGDFFRWLEVHRLPLFATLGPVSWADVDSIMEGYPELRFVLLEFGYRVNRELYPRLKAYKNLYLETSGLEQHCGILEITEQFGAERMLFGSRLPYFCAGAAIHAIEKSGISREEQRLIAGDNLRRLLQDVQF